MSTCYGTRRYGKLSECAECSLKTYCKDAGDPPSHPVEYNDEIADPVYVACPELESDSETVEMSEENFEIRSDLNHTIRHFFREIVRLTNADPVRVFIIIGKLGGLSHASIGSTCGMTKQAVSKHCHDIESRSNALGRFLKMKFAFDEEIARTFESFHHDIRRNDGRRHSK